MALFFFGGAKHVLEQQPLLIALEFLMVQKNMERKPFSYGLQKVSWHIIVLIALFFFLEGSGKIAETPLFLFAFEFIHGAQQTKGQIFCYVFFDKEKKRRTNLLLFVVFCFHRNEKCQRAPHLAKTCL